MFWSWVAQEREPEDRLIVLGNGCRPALPPWPGVEIREMPLVGDGDPESFPGLVHIDTVLEEGVPGDYVTHMDDDDMLVPGAFAGIRPFLDGRTVVPYKWVYAGETRARMYAEKPIELYSVPYVTRCFYPNRKPFPLYGGTFGGRKGGDGTFYRLIISEAEALHLPEEPLVVMSVGRKGFGCQPQS